MRPADDATAESVIHLEGILDGFVARRLQATLVRADAAARIRVDLTRVTEFHDFALAVLGQALACCKARVTLRGLRRSQLGVLPYYGVATAPLELAILSGAA
jgi:anti-anti-sigma regulatory factor